MNSDRNINQPNSEIFISVTVKKQLHRKKGETPFKVSLCFSSSSFGDTGP